MRERFVKKYMRLAKYVGEDDNHCYSRKIGVVIVDPRGNKILGTGYNSPPRYTPHCDDPGYLQAMVWPQLTNEEKSYAFTGSVGMGVGVEEKTKTDDIRCGEFCEQNGNKKMCPRKIVGAASGKRLELCSCVHGETNAIVNASDDLYGAHIFCWCGCPCVECTKLIINAGIKKVYIIDWGADYSHGSRWLFEKAGVEIEEHKPEYYLE